MSNRNSNRKNGLPNMEGAMSRSAEAAKQLLCGGVAGSVAKTVTAPFSRLTILYQVHSLVTTKHDRPKFAMSLSGGAQKILERGGIRSFWRGNMTSVLHRFPYSAINFFVYENTMDMLSNSQQRDEPNETEGQLVRRVSHLVYEGKDVPRKPTSRDETPALHKFMAGAVAGTSACLACYPLDLVRTRLTTQLEGLEHYHGIGDAFRKIAKAEGLPGFYSGVGPTLCVAVPNFSISYAVYGTLKEYTMDDELFYNLRRIDADSGETKLGFGLTIACGALSGTLATLVTFPMDTIRRRMQIQNLHFEAAERLTSFQHIHTLVVHEGLGSLYRGLTPELLKVIPMVGTMFVVYEWTKEVLKV
jgi:solute carrier family 25 phosphate transporter 23/24/25/41